LPHRLFAQKEWSFGSQSHGIAHKEIIYGAENWIQMTPLMVQWPELVNTAPDQSFSRRTDSWNYE
jgi:hypothetical protein